MTSVAANITAPSSSTANSAAAIAAPAGDDGFAAILGGEMNGATPENDADAKSDKAAVPASTADLAASQTIAGQAPATQTPDPATLALQEIPATDGKAAPCQPADNSDALSSAITHDVSGAVAPAPRGKISGNDSARPAGGARAEPARIAADSVEVPAQDVSPPTDPLLAQLLAAQQAIPATNTLAPKASDQAAAQTDPVANNSPADPAAPSDIAATSILTGGATVKPGKSDATDDKAPADSEKSQKQASTAAALTDLGKAASRVFADQRASAAHALNVHAAADQATNNNASGGSPSGQQNQNTAANTTSASAAEAPAANNFAPQAHIQASAQPDATAAVNAAAAAPAASTSATAPAQVSAQLHIARDTAAPDVNSLAFNIASKSEGGARHFDIRLDPAELGRVDVRLTVDDAGKAQASLSVEKPQTLELLQKDQGHLERALKDAGLDLSQNGLSFSLKGQQQQQAGGDATPRGRSHAMRAIAAVGETASTLSLGSAASSDARLDIRV